MQTIMAILEPDADGTLHLPLPPTLRRVMVKVSATIEAACGMDGEQEKVSPLGAFLELRRIGGLKQSISDPIAWQRAQRAERTLQERA